ncbi:MAG TPA: hypothetical protein VHT21_03210 [Stellaceae bacterium]|jgi:histidinol-phosphate aminotransferase|nr:hypothetical protein [Stellaceae bacterium]
MKAFWSRIACELSLYVPGEQPRIANLVKLNTNETPFGPSSRRWAIMASGLAGRGRFPEQLRQGAGRCG